MKTLKTQDEQTQDAILKLHTKKTKLTTEEMQLLLLSQILYEMEEFTAYVRNYLK